MRPNLARLINSCNYMPQLMAKRVTTSCKERKKGLLSFGQLSSTALPDNQPAMSDLHIPKARYALADRKLTWITNAFSNTTVPRRGM